jgi:ribose transport system substrate-binding protein
MSTPKINEGAATKPSVPSQAAQPGVSWLSKLIGVQGPLIGLVVLCIFFSFSTSGAFFSVRNALNVLALDSALDLIDGKQLPKEQLQEAVLTTKENVEPFIEKHP